MPAAMVRTMRRSRSSAVPPSAMRARSRRSSSRAPVVPPPWALISPRLPAPPCSRAAMAPHRLAHQLLEDGGGGLLAGHHADALARHQRAVLDIAVDHGAAQRRRPRNARSPGCAAFWSISPRLNLSMTLRWVSRKRLVAALAMARTGMTGKRGSSWIEGIASRAEARMKACLKLRMGDRFGGADEARAELARRPPPSPDSRDRLAAADAAGDEDRHVADLGQDLLGQHRCRHRADMAARLHALDHDRIGAGAHQLLGQDQGRGEAHQLGPALLDPLHGDPGRQAAGEHDMARPCDRGRHRSAAGAEDAG